MGLLLHLEADWPISQKVEVLQTFLGEEYFDERGLMYAMWLWRGDELRPFRNEDFAGVNSDLNAQGFEWAGHQNYENCASNSGLFLWSQALRFLVTGEDVALEYCRRAWNSLDTIFRMTEAQGHRGYLCKPWGGKVTNETTPDQYLFGFMGWWTYREVCVRIGDKATQARVDELIVASADWWRERDYCLTSFDQPMNARDRTSENNPGFTAMNQMAFLATGDQKYLIEAARLQGVLGAAPTRLDDMRLHLARCGSVRDESNYFQNFWYDESRKDFITLDFEWRGASYMSVLPLPFFFRHDLSRAPLLKTLLARVYEYIQFGLRDDLLHLYWVQIDVERNQWFPVQMKSTPQSREKPMYNWSLYSYLSEYCWGDTASRVPLVALMSHLWASEFCPGALTLCKRMLRVLDNRRLHWMIDPDGEQLEPTEKWITQVLSSDAPAMSCLTYWLARSYGLDLDA